MDSQKHNKLSVLMLPWLAYGHVSPFFELAKKLSLRNIHVYFCSTQINLDSIEEKLEDRDQNSIHFVSIELSSKDLPPDYHSTKNLPPHLMPALKTAFDESRDEFRNILKTLRPDFVVYDFLQQWAPEAAQELGIKAVMFLVSSAVVSSVAIHWCSYPEKEFPFNELKFEENPKVFEFMNERSNGIAAKDRFTLCQQRSSEMVLIKTSREIEAKYLDFVSDLIGKEMVPVGTLVQEPVRKEDDKYIMNWLDEKESDSVVYVSFGSEYFLSSEELEEVAHGLELSNVNFIWVVRFPVSDSKITVHERLPDGFLRRVGERGLVVEGWAPQARILEHSNIGGFISHCGWSSTTEAFTYGVPIIAMPMQIDQPFNAKLVVEIGAGIEVPRVNGMVDREKIGETIGEVMFGDGGKEVRRRSKELSAKLREIGDREIDVAVDKLLKLVNG